MKKLLALVLALVMTLGLATVSTNAAYSDEADVSLNEAVDVLSAVGVFQGSDGKFSPKANLTREQAAKLIAYLDLGENTAEALPAVKVFSDVAATDWSAKYVAYCADAGYIVGDGTGKFNPKSELTGYAFGKMLLCVLGYDSDVEGFTGGAWALNVAKLMENNDIADGISSAASLTLTREQAAQYCLNALKATMVEYDTKGTSIEINGAKIATGASKASDVEVADGTAYARAISKTAAGVKETVELGEKLYKGDLKLDTTKTDDFKASATIWTYKNSDVGTYADAADNTYTGKVTMGTIYTLLGKDVMEDLEAKKARMQQSVDGADKTLVVPAANTWKNNSGAAFSTGRGMVTELYIDDDGYNTYADVMVVVKNTYLLQATADYNAKTEKLSVKDYGGNGVKTLEADDFAVQDFKKDDYILYTYSKGTDKVQSIEKATVVSGNVETFKTSDTVTLDGTKYNYSTKFATIDGNGKDTKYSVKDVAKVVLDTQGNIIGIDSVKESNDNILYVNSVKVSGYTYQAKVVTVDGKKMSITVDDDSTYDAAGKTEITDDNVGNFKGIMAYKVNSDGEYKLSYYAKKNTASAADVTSLKLNKVTSLNGLTANSSTVYIIEDEDGDVTVYTGVKNAPETVSFKTASNAPVVVNSDGEILYLFAKATAGVEDSTNTNDEQIYVLKFDSTKLITDSDENEYYEAEALVNGEKEILKVAEGKTPFALKKLYKNIKTDSNGFVTGATLVSDDYDTVSFTNATSFKYSDETFTFTGAASKINSRFIKTDKVYLVISGTVKANELKNNDDASYEIADVSTFDEFTDFIDGYTVTGEGYLLLSDKASDAESELTAAYIWITAASETLPS